MMTVDMLEQEREVMIGVSACIYVHLWLSLQKCFQMLHSVMFGLGTQICIECSRDILAQGLLMAIYLQIPDHGSAVLSPVY